MAGLKEVIEDVLSTLDGREQKVIRLRFGFDDGRSQTFQEIGQGFNVTRERIAQIQRSALRKLRHPSRTRILKEYIESELNPEQRLWRAIFGE